ncbi:RHS repeat-associated core domain-containing protein [Thauera butanivorans]|uniref:RHS repeat-associated core domain-containing protein n=1 Tax=Thauera butanivorans TaxID=86174 RepID=UPI0008395461|nr:RHS repeat-associated core domain-containing protein [Thauera butanivorans]
MSTTPPGVQLATGACVLQGEDELDFMLDGSFALHWQRTYLSHNATCGLLGQGWTVPLSFALERAADHLLFVDLQGRRTRFPLLQVGEEFFSRYEHTTLRRTGSDAYELATSDGLRLLFAPLADGQAVLPLQAMLDANDNGVHLQYGPHGLPLVLQGTDGYRLGFAYDLALAATARLVEVQRLHGEPDANGRYPTHARQLLVHYRYSAEGNLAEVHDGAGRCCRSFEYAGHILTGHRQPSGLTARYAWSAHQPHGQVLSMQLSSGRRWQLHYDAAARSTRVLEQAEGLARTSTHYFDADHHLVALVDALGGTTRIERDEFGHILAHTDPQGGTTRYTYDARGNVLGITGPDGATDTLQWDARLRKPTAVTDALGHTTRHDYDARGNLLRSTAADGGQTTYERDARGLPVAIVDARGGRKTLAWDAAGRLLAYTDCSGHTTRYAWDMHGNLVAVTDALGQRTAYTYRFINRQARLSRLDLPDGSCERFAYDAQGRLTAHHDALGHTTFYRLDSDGRPLARTDALGHHLDYRYDGFGRLLTLRNENGAHYRFAWDALDRLSAEQGFDGRRIDYRYSAAGHLLEAADGVPVGAPLLGRGCAGVLRTHYRRDAAGRLLEKRAVKPGARALRTRYAWDAAGQLVLARNAFARVQLAYTATGQIACEQTRSRFGPHTQLLHRYDALGQRIATTLPDGRILNTLTYGSGHVHQINLDGEVLCDFERDALHREVWRSQGALHSRYALDPLGRLLASQAGTAESPAPAGAAQPHKAASASTGQRIARRYRYDAAGQLLTLDDARLGLTRYRYDALGRLLAARTPTQEERFAFDPAHNLIEPGADAPATTAAPAPWGDEDWAEHVRTHLPNPHFNPLGTADDGHDPRQWPGSQGKRLAVWQEHRYAYDAWGNCIEKKSGKHRRQTFHWDAEHQLAAVGIDDARQEGPHYWAYAYDPFGRRIAKWRTAQAQHHRRPAPDAITHFTWDGNRLLAEQRPARHPRMPAQARHTLYLYEPDSFVPLAQVTTTGPWPEDARDLPDITQASQRLQQQYPEAWAANVLPLQRRIAARLKHGLPQAPKKPAPTAQVLYYHTDHLGTPRELTDTDGHIVWEAHYKAWGGTRHIEYPPVLHTSADGNTVRQYWIEPLRHERPMQNLRFQGQYYDEETGLHYNRFRYYDPDIGRFVSQDPIGLAGGVNTYQYAPNPVTWIDPLGLNKGCKCAAESNERAPWKVTKEGTERVVQHDRFGKIFKSESDGLWWAKDNAGHGGSEWKVFRETSKGLEWYRDADKYGDFIVGKHKGDTGKFIPWKEVRGGGF